jgi:uncharacterized membrane protein
MNSTKTTTELKSLARELLMGKYGSYILAFLTIEIIILALTMITDSVTSSKTLWATILYLLFVIVIELIASVFSLGLIRFTLNISRNQSYALKDIFYGFTAHPDKAIISKFLLLLMDFVCILPAVLFFILYYIAQDTTFLIVVASLLLVIGGVISVILHLTFDMVFYTLVDYPDATVMELFRYCANVMKGDRVKLFYLIASFLPLYVLGILSCGIGLFFVIPYQNVAIALFYQDVFYITEVDETENVVNEVSEQMDMA